MLKNKISKLRQEDDSQWQKKRLAFMCLTLFLLIGIAVWWIANVGTRVSDVIGIVFTLGGTMLAVLQWPLLGEAQEAIPPAKEASQQRFYEQTEGVFPETDKRRGALVVYTRKELRGAVLNLSFGFSGRRMDVASSVVGREKNGSLIFLAVFPLLEAGNYTVSTDAQELITRVSIVPGRVEEVDWR